MWDIILGSHLPADIVNKAKLFDAKLDKGDHLSKSRIIQFIVEQAYRSEDAFEKIRKLTRLILHPPATLMIQQSLTTATRLETRSRLEITQTPEEGD